MREIGLGFGSNVGDKVANLHEAMRRGPSANATSWNAFETYRDVLETQANGWPINKSEVFTESGTGITLVDRVRHAPSGTNDDFPGGECLFHPQK